MRSFTIVFALVVAFGSGPQGRADLITVPNVLENVEGNSSNPNPFGFQEIRYQQVYSNSQFVSFGGPRTITGMRLRLNGGDNSGALTTNPNRLRISLSTTSANPDALSNNFASNLGSDTVLVFSQFNPVISATGVGATPNPFNAVITFQTPFEYNPVDGNLLLEVRNAGFGTGLNFDAADVGGDPISRVFAIGNENASFATGADSLGLVTQFEFESATVPEPSSFLLVFGMGAAMAVAGWRRRRKSPRN